jgi:hypothetical protein
MAKRLIVPTALNVLNAINENIVANLRRDQDAALEFPSLYRLAFMVYNNTGEIMVETTEIDPIIAMEG